LLNRDCVRWRCRSISTGKLKNVLLLFHGDQQSAATSLNQWPEKDDEQKVTGSNHFAEIWYHAPHRL
jgi:hypothetical protein